MDSLVHTGYEEAFETVDFTVEFAPKKAKRGALARKGWS